MKYSDSSTRIALVALLAVLGTWGCAKVSGESEEDPKIRAMEMKAGRLEADLRTATAERDQLRQKLEAVEKERTAAQKQTQIVLQERNDLRLQLNARTTERDNMQSQYESFRNDMRRLLNQADAAVNQSASQPVTVVTPTTTPKS